MGATSRSASWSQVLSSPRARNLAMRAQSTDLSLRSPTLDFPSPGRALASLELLRAFGVLSSSVGLPALPVLVSALAGFGCSALRVGFTSLGRALGDQGLLGLRCPRIFPGSLPQCTSPLVGPRSPRHSGQTSPLLAGPRLSWGLRDWGASSTPAGLPALFPRLGLCQGSGVVAFC